MSRNKELPDQSIHNMYVVSGDSKTFLHLSTIFVEFPEMRKYGILEIMVFHYGNRIMLWDIHTY